MYKEEPIIFYKREYAYIMGRNRSIDIDMIDDFNYATYIIVCEGTAISYNSLAFIMFSSKAA